MRDVSVVLAYLAVLCCGRRVHLSPMHKTKVPLKVFDAVPLFNQEHYDSSRIRATRVFHPVTVFARFLTVLKPVVAFFPSGAFSFQTPAVSSPARARSLGHSVGMVLVNGEPEPAAELLVSSRRAALCTTLLTGIGLALPARPAAAESAPRITSRAQLSIEIGRPKLQASRTTGSPVAQPARQVDVTVGLYGDDAPAYVKLFEQVCTGSVPNDPLLSFDGNTAYRVERGRLVEFGNPSDEKVELKEIDGTGRLRTKYVKKEARFVNVASNGLSHNRAGLISMRQDGLANDFIVTTGADPALDAEYVVIGEILSGMSAIEDIDQLPTFKRSEVSVFGGTAALYGLRGGLGLGVGLYVTSRINVPFGVALGCLTAAGMSLVGDDPRDYNPDTLAKPLTTVTLERVRLV